MTVSAQDIAGVLGIDPQLVASSYALAEALEQGLPVSTVERVQSLLSPGNAKLRDLLVARATLARRKRHDRLSPAESERVERLARIWAFAREVWQDDEAARRFLMEGHPLLHGRTPVELAARTDVGARLVEDILGRLKYGSAA